MSLNAQDPRCAVVLKTADQYTVWKSRVGDACWAACHKDIWKVNFADCHEALTQYDDKKDVDLATKSKNDWVGHCWMIITSSLHDELYTRVSHVSRGDIPGLLKEISHALVINTAEDVQPLRLKVYGANMQKDADNDLQKWIAFLTECNRKLDFLGKPMEEEELVGVFLKGLNPVFNALQIHFAIPKQMPKKFIECVEITRKYAATPLVAAELAKLKASGLSQSTFLATAGTPTATAGAGNRALCKLYARSGSCRFGAKCKFVHTAAPSNANTAAATATPAAVPTVKCSFCGNRGHTVDVCRKRQAQNASSSAKSSAASLVAANDDCFQDFTLQDAVTTATAIHDSLEHKDPYTLVFTTVANADAHGLRWVMDSGATCCATFSQDDCTNIRDCNIPVTAAGSTFIVHTSTLLTNKVAHNLSHSATV